MTERVVGMRAINEKAYLREMLTLIEKAEAAASEEEPAPTILMGPGWGQAGDVSTDGAALAPLRARRPAIAR